jgi:hypothetical protein
MANLDRARRRVAELRGSLEMMVTRDPEQEVQGIAIPVLDATIRDVKDQLSDDPVVQAMSDIISPEMIEAGETLRAVDALVVVRQLDAAIPPRRPTIA